MSYENIYVSLFKAKQPSSFMGLTLQEQCYTAVHEDLFVQILLKGTDTSMLVRVAARSKAYSCGRSPAEIVGSNPTGSMDVCPLRVLSVVR